MAQRLVLAAMSVVSFGAAARISWRLYGRGRGRINEEVNWLCCGSLIGNLRRKLGAWQHQRSLVGPIPLDHLVVVDLGQFALALALLFSNVADRYSSERELCPAGRPASETSSHSFRALWRSHCFVPLVRVAGNSNKTAPRTAGFPSRQTTTLSATRARGTTE